MKNKKVSFSYILRNVTPSTAVTITATYDVERSDVITNINVLNIAYVKNGERLGANIDTLLKGIAPHIYSSIVEEIKSYATKELNYYKATVV